MKNDKLRWAHRFRCFPPSRVCNKSIALTEAAIREFQYAVKEEVEVERALGHVPMRPLQGDIRADITFYLPDVYKRYDLAGMAQTVMQALRNGVLFVDDDQVVGLDISKSRTPPEEWRGMFSLIIWED